MRIYRSNPDDCFTIVPNAALQDQRLSYTARGVLAELLSRPDGWNTNADGLSRLATKHRSSKNGEGRRAIRSAFAELEELGYMVRTKAQDKDGRFVTGLAVHDTAGHRRTESGTPDVWASLDDYADRRTGSRTSANGTSVDGTSESGTSLVRTEQQRTDQESTEDKHSSSLADTRAAAAAASARSRETELNEFYEAVERLDDKTLRNALLTFENKRPRIYRSCRIKTADQYNEKDPRILKADNGARSADVLSYKYALRHYFDTADEWPVWLIRPLPQAVHLKSVS